VAYVGAYIKIMAEAATGPMEATRGNVASALCLADRWSETGYKNIRIIDPEGAVQTCASLRATLPIVKRTQLRLSKRSPASA
jgi:hypothetical protein